MSENAIKAYFMAVRMTKDQASSSTWGGYLRKLFLQNDYPYLVFEILILGRVENRRQTFFFLFIMGEIRYNKSQTGNCHS